MFLSLPLPRSSTSASKGGEFAPEWKVTMRGLDRRTSDRAGQRIEARAKLDKNQYPQRFAAKSSETKSRAEGAIRSSKVTKFHTPFRVNIPTPGMQGRWPLPAGGIFNLFSSLLVKSNP
ncbi:hypothetical protein [Novosphingobium sp.]|uniref:hypothetical protein n=1 Tax=Novosphingobium sp. TaxID=1874826 RepID=UPI0025E5FEB8|nr:hypothetical protein [Novosphingobium sp.]